jgi:hypothetical protein
VGSLDVVLCQVKSNAWPGARELRALADFRVPPGVRKVVHRWRDRRRLPDVREF